MSAGGARDPEGGARDPEGGARDPEGGARDPEGEAAVRRMLAAAGGPAAMPAEVVARLDDVLAGLERERSAGSEAAGNEVVALRSRRRWPRLLLAAAAVVVGGYSVGTVLTQGTLSGSESAVPTAESGAASDDGAERGVARQDDERAAGRAEDNADAPAEGTVEEAPQGGTTSGFVRSRGRPVQLRSDALETDVRRALRVLDREVAAMTGRPSDLLVTGRWCFPPALEEGERSIRVRYDTQRAVLVAAPDDRGEVTVAVYDCAGTELDRTVVAR